jgi:curved DNA-binding protein CbpA
MPTPSRSDHYATLQVHPDAEPEVVDAAYRKLASKYHPDVNGSSDANERMATINAAYDVLSDPNKRARYDAQRSGRTVVGGRELDVASLLKRYTVPAAFALFYLFLAIRVPPRPAMVMTALTVALVYLWLWQRPRQ